MSTKASMSGVMFHIHLSAQGLPDTKAGCVDEMLQRTHKTDWSTLIDVISSVTHHQELRQALRNLVTTRKGRKSFRKAVLLDIFQGFLKLIRIAAKLSNHSPTAYKYCVAAALERAFQYPNERSTGKFFAADFDSAINVCSYVVGFYSGDQKEDPEYHAWWLEARRLSPFDAHVPLFKPDPIMHPNAYGHYLSAVERMRHHAAAVGPRPQLRYGGEAQGNIEIEGAPEIDFATSTPQYNPSSPRMQSSTSYIPRTTTREQYVPPNPRAFAPTTTRAGGAFPSSPHLPELHTPHRRALGPAVAMGEDEPRTGLEADALPATLVATSSSSVPQSRTRKRDATTENAVEPDDSTDGGDEARVKRQKMKD